MSRNSPTHCRSLLHVVITTWALIKSSGESLPSLCGPLSGHSRYSQPLGPALSGTGSDIQLGERALDPQMPLLQSLKLGGGLEGSLSPKLQIQLVRKFPCPPPQSMSRIPSHFSPPLSLPPWPRHQHLPPGFYDHPTRPSAVHPGSPTWLFSTQQQSRSQIISLLHSAPQNNGLNLINMLRSHECTMILINHNNNKEEPDW